MSEHCSRTAFPPPQGSSFQVLHGETEAQDSYLICLVTQQGRGRTSTPPHLQNPRKGSVITYFYGCNYNIPQYHCSIAKPKGAEEKQVRGGCCNKMFLKHVLGEGG